MQARRQPTVRLFRARYALCTGQRGELLLIADHSCGAVALALGMLGDALRCGASACGLQHEEDDPLKEHPSTLPYRRSFETDIRSTFERERQRIAERAQSTVGDKPTPAARRPDQNKTFGNR